MPTDHHRNPREDLADASFSARQGAAYPLMLDAIGDAICMFDVGGELTWQNKACLILCNSITGKAGAITSLTDNFTEAQLADFRKHLYRAIGGERVFFEWICVRRPKGFLMELRPLRDEQQVIGVMGTVRESSDLAAATPAESADGIKRVFERVTDAFFALDKDWNYTYLNSKAEELHGRTAAELIGKNIWAEFPDVVNEPFYQSLHKAMNTQQPVRVESLYSSANKWYEDFIYPSPEGVSVYYRDITAHKNTEDLLIRSEEQYRSLVEQAADAIIIADLQGRCLDVNSMAEKMTGYTRQELAGINIFHLLVIPPGEPPIRMPEILDHKAILQEREIRRKDGSVFYAELNSKLLTGDRILVIGRDISDRKRMEMELQESEFRYRTLFEEGADGVCFYDIVKDCYIGVNKRMTELFGYSKEEFLRLKVTDITFPDEVRANPPRYNGLVLGVTITNERYFRRKDGKGICLETSTRRLTESSFVSFMRDITARKEAENLIKENELRWKLALDTSELGVWEMNFEKHTAFISEKTREQTGYINETDLANPDFWLSAIYKEDQDATLRHFIQTLKGIQPSFDATFRVVCRNGEMKWFRFTGKVTDRDITGRARRIIGVHEHITERVMKEKDLWLKGAAMESSLSGIGMADLEGRITYVNSAIVKMWGARDSTQLIGKHLTEVFYGEEVFNSMKLLQTQGTAHGEDTALRLDGTVFPVEFSANVIKDEKGKPACLFGSFIDITQRKDAQIRLAESETLFREITQHSPSGIVLLDKNFKFKFISDSARRITGYLDDELIGADPEDFIHPDDLPGLQKILQEMIRVPGKVVTTQYRFRYKDNSWHNLESTYSNLLLLKEVEVVSINFRDIHTEKLVQLQLKESEEKFRTLVQQAADGIFLVDEDGNYLDANESAARLTGYTIGELKKMNASDLADTQDMKNNPIKLEEIKKGQPVFTERIIRRKDNITRHVEISAKLISKGRVITILRDITERKEYENELLRSRRSLNLALETNQCGVWDHDLVTDKYTRTILHDQIFGYNEVLPLWNFDVFLDHVIEDDREYVRGFLNEASANKTGWNFECRIRRTDGEIRWILSTGGHYKDSKGMVLGMSGLIQDITTRKKAEEKLANEKLISESLINNLPGIFYLYTNEGKFLRWNKNFESKTGYSAGEIRTMHPLDFYEGEQREKIKNRINHLFHEPVPGIEVIINTRDKRKLPVFINSMALIYEGIPCVVGMGTDISQLKRTQQALIESEEAFNRLFHESSEAILLLDGRHFIDCNDATISLLGYSSRQELLHQSPWKISPRKQPDGIPSIRKAKSLIQEALEKGYHRFEWIHRKADGTDFPVEVMLTPIFIKGRQLFYTVWRDITDRKKAELALQESIKEISAYKYALDQATIVSFSDPAGNITYVNNNFERLYGYQKEEIIGVNHSILNSGIHPGEFWKKFWQAIKSGQVFQSEVCNKAKDGSLHWADTTIVPFLDEKGKPTQFLAIRSDITEKRKLELELKERERMEQIRLTETALEAQEKERNFLGQELHDNVNQILVGTKLILSVVAEDPVRYMDVLHSSIENIQRAIQENRKLSHSLATPDMKLMSLDNQLVTLASDMFYQQPVKVSFSRKGYDDTVLDEKKKIALYRIAQEQCTNIIKYARASKVDIQLRIKKDFVQLVIKDDGIGMEDGKSSDGIGIRNMRGRVSIYGGRLDIDTAPGKGFTLTVGLPIR